MKAIITVGVSASGKTTWAQTVAQDPQWVITSRDNIRFTHVQPGGNWLTYRFTKTNEAVVTKIQKEEIQAAAQQKRNLIACDTNLNYDRNEQLQKELESLGYEVEYMVFQITFEDACARDAYRENGVGYSVIARQIEQFNEFMRRFDEVDFTTAIPTIPDLPKAVIVDIDGTLAHMKGRSPFEWLRVGEDAVDPIVCTMVQGLRNQGYTILITSGRDEVCRNETTQWLIENKVPFDRLFMRPQGSYRPDTVVKMDIFNDHIFNKYDVHAAIDDRPVVCRMWRSLGIKVVQLGNPYIEF